MPVAPTKFVIGPAIPIPPALERTLDSREAGYYDGNDNNTYGEHITWNSDNGFNFRDVVYGDGGYDYISTGGGNDKIVLGSNWGTWRGSGNEFGNAAIADGSSGDDYISVRGTEGAYHIMTGEGRDTVNVTGATQTADYVRINAYDSDTQRDSFTFGANFNGDAEIWGADAHDVLKLDGDDWHLASTAGGNMVYANSTGGSVTMTGVSAYNDPDVLFL